MSNQNNNFYWVHLYRIYMIHLHFLLDYYLNKIGSIFYHYHHDTILTDTA